MNEFDDIEQMLKPQCEFKASETLKQEVMQKAREEVSPRRTVRLWPWLAAACVLGYTVMFLMPPKSTTDGEQPVAKVEMTKAAETKQVESMPEPITTIVETPKSRKAAPFKRKSRQEAPTDEPVQMSEETRLALLMASLKEDSPQPEDINPEEEIRQLRKRGERLISMYEANDK